MIRRRFVHVVSLITLSALSLVGCGGEGHQGTLTGPPASPSPVPRRPSVTLRIAPVDDRRPRDEHEGDSIRTALFIFFGVGVHLRREGNYVTNAETSSPQAPAELRALAASQLRASGVARSVVLDGGADFELRLRMDHLYGTHYAANKQTIVVLDDKRSLDAFVDVRSHRYAGYGNVVLEAELVDLRSGAAVPVWREKVAGFAQRPPSEDRIAGVQAAIQLATADALATLGQRVGAALDRLQVGPSGAPVLLANGSPLPSVFAIERISRFRDFLERVFVETATGRVVRHEITPAPDRYASRPGDWLLSRQTADGLRLSPDGYEAFARALASRYDLRLVDDVDHYHFFGLLGQGAATP